MRINRFIATMRGTWDRTADLLLAAGCFLLSLVLYLQTLAPSIVTLFDDSLEFPLVAYRLAIAHPTGYPLYTLLAKLLSLGPGYNVAWSVNLLSALAGSLTVALVYLVARQLIQRRWPALLGAAALAVSPIFWSQSVVAEVYTLNAAFVAGLLALALRWAQKPLAPVRPFSLLLVGPREPRPQELQPKDLRPEETLSEEVPPEDAQPADERPEGFQSKEVQPIVDLQPEEALSEEVQAEDTQPGDERPEGLQPEEAQLKDLQLEARRALFLPGEGLWMRLPPAIRQVARRFHAAYLRLVPLVRHAAHRVHAVYLRLVPPVRQAAHWVRGATLRLIPLVRRAGRWVRAVYRRVAPVVHRAAQRATTLYRRFYPAVPPSRRLQLHRLTYALAFLTGLGLAHHRTILLLVPALLVFAFLVDRRVFSRAALLGPEHRDLPRWRQFVVRPGVLLAASFLAPLLLYLYLPIRGSAGSLDGTYANTWSGFWHWITTGGYGTFLGDNPLARSLDAGFYGRLFWQQFGPVGLALALVGVVGLLRRPRALALTGLAFVAYVAFAIVYRVPDVEVFFIPAFVLVAIWIAVGLDHAVSLLRLRGPSLALRRVQAVSALLLVLAAVGQPLVFAVGNYSDLDLSRSWLAHDYGRYVLNQDLPYGNSTIVGLGGEMNLLRYFQETTGLGADVETVIADDEAARRAAVETALAQGRAVYLTRPLSGLAGDHTLDAVTGLMDAGDDLEMLLRVDAPDGKLPPMPPGTVLQQARGMRLLSAQLEEHREHWQAWARLRLWWRTPRGLGENLKVSARLEELGGRVIAAVDAEPVGGAYPTTAWRPGEIVADVYEIPLPAGTPPGDYKPVIVIYDPATGEERGRIELFAMHLEGNRARPPRRVLEASVAETVYARFGGLDLLGFTPPDPGTVRRPGDWLPLTLLWQASARPEGDLQLSFLLEGDRTYALDGGSGWSEENPLPGWAVGGVLYPTARWQPGQVVRQWPVVQVPEGIPPGEYRLKMRVTCDGVPVAWGRGPFPWGSDLDLGAVQIGS